MDRERREDDRERELAHGETVASQQDLATGATLASGPDLAMGATLESGTGAAPARLPPTGFARGASIGRFLVVDRLGAGGMGVVLSAYDPDLDRRIAIKLLRPDVHGLDSGAARTRLLREAQAMAKVDHPNVITVHEVGVVGDQVFVAMEYVEGGTLRRLLDGPRRPWREVLDLYLAAGRGLAAAHAAGLVHRDFKPDNVLVSSDGKVRVSDFGLVGTHGDLTNLAGIHGDQARWARAEELLGRAVELQRRYLGGSHPDLGMSLTGHGAVLTTLQAYDRAQAALEEALRIYEASVGRDHPSTAFVIANLGGVELARGDAARAVELLRDAARILAASLGSDHAYTLQVELNLGDALARAGDATAAIAVLAAALPRMKATIGDRHLLVARLHQALAQPLVDAGRQQDAERHLRDAVAIFEETSGATNPNTSAARAALGDVLWRRKREGEAIEVLEQAVTGLDADDGGDTFAAARARFWLARALWSRPDARPRALELARAALATLVTIEQTTPVALRAEVEDWLRARGP